MKLRIGRTLPPAASPIRWNEILDGIKCIQRRHNSIERFAKEIKKQFNVAHCFLVSSGKTALTVTLKALHEIHPDRDEVVIPAFSCYSVPSSIKRAGLKIRLCDIDAYTVDYDYRQLENIINKSQYNNGKSKILAVIPIHMFGIPSNIDRIHALRKKTRFWIIEDAAQAMGNRINSKPLGTIGDVGIFSTGRGKTISAVEGGIIITSNNEIAKNINKQVEQIQDYSLTEILFLIGYAISLNILLNPYLFWIPKMIPFLKLGETIYDPNFRMRKMSSFQAGLLGTWIPKLKEMQNVRERNVNQWLEMVDKINSKIFKIPEYAEKNINGQSVMDCALIRLPITVVNSKVKSKLLQISEMEGLGIMSTYPDSVNNIAKLRNQFKNEHYSNAKRMVQKTVTLPTHLFVSFSDIIRVSNILNKLDEESINNANK